MRRRLPLAIAAVLVIAAGSIWGARIATRHPSIALNPRVVDFGPLVTRATRTVAVSNTGRAPLRVLTISTSCGCTTAAIDATTVAPGGAATLAITFDPVAHGPVAGPARHAVYLRTNDPRTPEAEVEVRAVVVKKAAR